MDIYDFNVPRYHRKFSIHSQDNIDTTIEKWVVEIYPKLGLVDVEMDEEEVSDIKNLKAELRLLVITLKNALKIFENRIIASISGKIANRVRDSDNYCNQFDWYLIEVFK